MRSRTRHLILGILVIVAAVLLCRVMHAPASLEMDDVLRAAGLAILPEDVNGVKFERQGGLFRPERILLTFSGRAQEIDRWVAASPTIRSGALPVLSVSGDEHHILMRREKGLTYPNWWPAMIDVDWGDVYRVSSKRFTGPLVIDYDTKTVFLHLRGSRSWLDRLRARLPFG